MLRTRINIFGHPVPRRCPEIDESKNSPKIKIIYFYFIFKIQVQIYKCIIFTSFYFNPLTKLIRYFCCFCGLIVRRDFSCPFRQSLGLSLVLFSSFIDVELLNRGCLDFKLILMRYRNERRSVRAFVISEDLSENSRKPRSC